MGKRAESSPRALNAPVQAIIPNIKKREPDEKEFSCMGGGFPIRVEEVGVIGAIVVTDQNPFINHDIIVKTIGKYLHVDEVPRIRAL